MSRGKKRKYKGKKQNNNNVLSPLQREREESADTFISYSLVDKDKLDNKEYDFTIISDIYTLLYGFNMARVVSSCSHALDRTIDVGVFKNSKVENYYKSGNISDFTKTIVKNIIPERFKGFDETAKLKVMKMLLGYYLIKQDNTYDADLVIKSIYLAARDNFDTYVYKETRNKKVDFTYSTQEPISKDDCNVSNRVFTDKEKVNYIEDLAPYYQKYLEDYVDLGETNKSINALEKVSDANREVFEIIQNIGYKTVTKDELNEIAIKKLSKEAYNQYQKGVVELNLIYYKLVMPMSYFISQKELSVLLKNERDLNSERFRELNENLKLESSEHRTLKKNTNKYEKEIEELKSQLVATQSSLEQLSNSKCEEDKYKEVVEELKKKELENKELEQEVIKWKNKLNGCQSRIKVLEEKVEEFSNVTNDIVELQQENNLLNDAILKIEDLTSDDTDEIEGLTYEEMLEYIKDLKILFIGGPSNTGVKLKEILPNLDFIDISERNFNFGIPETIDCVVMYPRFITHAHTDRVFSLVGNNTPVIYVNALNSKLVVQEVYKQILDGHK